MPISYGDYSARRVREIFQSNIKAISIDNPAAGSSNGSPIQIKYTLDSDILDTATTVEVEYSTNSGGAWNTATALPSDPAHSGTTNLAVDTNNKQFTFVWNSATDLTTAFQASTVRVRVRANDGSANSNYATSADFEIDMLPGSPTLVSPSDLYFDADTTPDFIWTIPTDPGADRISFCIEIDDSEAFDSLNINHNSQDHTGRFMHRISASPGTKNGANSQTYYVKGLTVSSVAGTATTFASLTDHHKDAAIPSSLTNPQILILNRADRPCYITPASISSTGFTIFKSAAGIATNGLVDLIIFSGASGAFNSFWVNITGLSTSTSYTYGVAPFDTDLLGNSIPGSITNGRPLLLQGNDCPVVVTAASNTGFTVEPSGSRVDATATFRVCLRATPSAAYIHTALAVTSFSNTTVDYSNTLNDSTNGGADWPDYIPGAILTDRMLSDRLVYFPMVNNDGTDVAKSAAGIAADGSVDVHGHSEPDASINYWTDVPPLGVPDTYEGNQCRYRLVAADALATGFYNWRVRGGNIP